MLCRVQFSLVLDVFAIDKNISYFILKQSFFIFQNNLINMFGKLILTQSKLNQDNKYGLTNNNDSNNNNHMNNNSEFSDIEYWLKVVGVNKKLVRVSAWQQLLTVEDSV